MLNTCNKYGIPSSKKAKRTTNLEVAGFVQWLVRFREYFLCGKLGRSRLHRK